jgi:hypothetical protein
VPSLQQAGHTASPDGAVWNLHQQRSPRWANVLGVRGEVAHHRKGNVRVVLPTNRKAGGKA